MGLPGSGGLPSPPSDVVDADRWATLRAWLGEEKLWRVVTSFLNGADGWLEDLDRAVARRSGAQVERLAHQLGGGARNLGAISMATCCDRLGQLARAEDFEDAAEALTRVRTELFRIAAAFPDLREPT